MNKKSFILLSFSTLALLVLLERVSVSLKMVSPILLIFLLPIPYIILGLRDSSGYFESLSMVIQGTLMLVFGEVFLFGAIFALSMFTLIVIRLIKQGENDAFIIFFASIIFVVLFAVFLHLVKLPEFANSPKEQQTFTEAVMKNLDEEKLKRFNLTQSQFEETFSSGLRISILLLPSTVMGIAFLLSAFLFYFSVSLFNKLYSGEIKYSFSKFELPKNFGMVIGLMTLVAFFIDNPIGHTFLYNLGTIGFIALIFLGLSTLAYLLNLRGPGMFTAVIASFFFPLFDLFLFFLGVAEHAFSIRKRFYQQKKR